MRIPAAWRVLALLVVVAHPATAQRFISTGLTDQAVLAFFHKLQVAVVANDRATVTSMVHFPLSVNHGSVVHEKVASRADLMKQYDKVFTPAIRQAIILEKPSTLYGNAQGVYISRGTVWMQPSCGKSRPVVCTLGISSVNLPAPTAK